MKQLLRSYEKTYGKPDSVIELQADEERIAFQVAVRNPKPKADLPDSAITSLGLSALSEHDVELHLEVAGKLTKKTIEETGIFYYTFYQQLIAEEAIVPGSIYRSVEVPGFDKMSAVMIMNKGYLETEWLDHEKETGQVISIVPLFDAEADELETLPVGIRELVLYRAKLPVTDPERKKAAVVHLAMLHTWQRIAAWYKEHKANEAATLLDTLKGKKTEAPAAALEEKLEINLPEDFKASFNIVSERIVLGDHTLYDEKSMLETARYMNELNEDGTFKKALKKIRKDSRIQPVWWHDQWIPVAVNSYNDRICIDMSPGPEGIAGQVIIHDNESGPIATDFNTFFEWLDEYETDLKRGRFHVDGNGNIQRG